MGVRSFEELRAWQASRAFKVAVYRLCESGTLASDLQLREQLCRAAASAASHVAEGFGRFNPADFARFLTMAKASLVEAQNHLHDAVDRNHIGEAVRAEYDHLARAALRDVMALLEYLQSPTAAEKARIARAKRQRRRTPN